MNILPLSLRVTAHFQILCESAVSAVVYLLYTFLSSLVGPCIAVPQTAAASVGLQPARDCRTVVRILEPSSGAMLLIDQVFSSLSVTTIHV